MIVTGIEQLGKGRYRILLDDRLAFVLYRGELSSFNIEVNEEMSQETYDYIVSEVLPKRVKLRAMNLLMKRSYTIRQLRDKLSDGGYSDDLVDDAINYVSSFGYIDDKRYAYDFIECHKLDKSVTRIKQDLLSKGIDKQIVNEAIDSIMASSDPVDEISQIKKLLDKRHFSYDSSTYEEKRKTYAFLMRKGFSASVVSSVLRDTFAEE